MRSSYSTVILFVLLQCVVAQLNDSQSHLQTSNASAVSEIANEDGSFSSSFESFVTVLNETTPEVAHVSSHSREIVGIQIPSNHSDDVISSHREDILALSNHSDDTLASSNHSEGTEGETKLPSDHIKRTPGASNHSEGTEEETKLPSHHIERTLAAANHGEGTEEETKLPTNHIERTLAAANHSEGTEGETKLPSDHVGDTLALSNHSHLVEDKAFVRVAAIPKRTTGSVPPSKPFPRSCKLMECCDHGCTDSVSVPSDAGVCVKANCCVAESAVGAKCCHAASCVGSRCCRAENWSSPQYLAHPSLKNVFYECSWGKAYPFCCPDGTVYSHQLHVCVQPE